jgi:hypothetical protein
MPLYNVINTKTKRHMLGMAVESKVECLGFLEYYRDTYGSGKPYPNGKGTYDGEFALAIYCPGCGRYHLVQ